MNKSAAEQLFRRHVVTPFWFDAFIVTFVIHLGLGVYRYRSSSMVTEHLLLPSEPWWWLLFFLPCFGTLLLVAFFSRRQYMSRVGLTAFVLYLIGAAIAPHLME